MPINYVTIITPNHFLSQGIIALMPGNVRNKCSAIKSVKYIDIANYGFPDLIILDTLPLVNDEFLRLKALKACHPQVRIVVFGTRSCFQMHKTRELGVTLLLPRCTSPDTLRSQLARILQAKIIPDMTDEGIIHNSPSVAGDLRMLTNRELQVYLLLIQGQQNHCIASTFRLSEKTVSTHKINLMNKLQATHVSDLLRIAREQGIV